MMWILNFSFATLPIKNIFLSLNNPNEPIDVTNVSPKIDPDPGYLIIQLFLTETITSW